MNRQVEHEFRKCYPPTEAGQLNIVCMGGDDDCKMYVEPSLEERKRFWSDYLCLVRNGVQLTIKEQICKGSCSRWFKLFLDIDFDFGEEVPNIRSIMRVIHNLVKQQYGPMYGEGVNMVVVDCRSEYKWHFTFPAIIDTPTNFKKLHSHFVRAFAAQVFLDGIGARSLICLCI